MYFSLLYFIHILSNLKNYYVLIIILPSQCDKRARMEHILNTKKVILFILKNYNYIYFSFFLRKLLNKAIIKQKNISIYIQKLYINITKKYYNIYKVNFGYSYRNYKI